MKLLKSYKPFIIVFFTCLYLNNVNSQVFTLSGQVRDKNSNKVMAGAVIYDNINKTGTTSGPDGKFFMRLPKGKVQLSVRYIGYTNIDTVFYFKENIILVLNLIESIYLSEEVVVVGEQKDKNIREVKSGFTKLNFKEINHLPVLFGEADPLKILQLTPGIQSGKEGNTGFYVRGGGVDQNLILLDGVHLYNAGHLMGFFSVFNPDVVSSINLSKSGFSAYHGGRLSSVLEVNTVKPDLDEWHFSGGIGVISSRFCVNGPIKKRRSGLLIAARRTYFDILIQPLFKNALEKVSTFFTNSSYNFYDINASYYNKFGNNDQLSFTFFKGADHYTFFRDVTGLRTGSDWGNMSGSVKWQHLFHSKLSMDHMVSYTQYDFFLFGNQSDYYFSMNSGVNDYSYKSRIMWLPNNNHKIISGWEYIYHIILPNKIETRAADYDLDFPDLKVIKSNELSFFAEDEFNVTSKLRLSLGLRYSVFFQKGPFSREIKNESGETTDTLVYGKDDFVAKYNHPEPRISIRYLLNSTSSVKASFTQGYQYIHLATSSSIALPTDIWMSSSDVIPPQKGYQLSTGYFKNFTDNMWETSLEVYYKNMKSQSEFLNGIINNSFYNRLDENIVTGKAFSYGIEMYIKKSKGNTTGWLSYTLSRTEKLFAEINDNRKYPAKYDRTHDISAVVSQKLNKKWTFSSTFVFATGNAYTIPVYRYMIQGNLLNAYGEINRYRMPSYHRMDISFNRIVKKEKITSEWNFSVYNIYNRANPYFIYYDTKGDLDRYKLEVTLKKVTLFPIIPSVSWNIRF